MHIFPIHGVAGDYIDFKRLRQFDYTPKIKAYLFFLSLININVRVFDRKTGVNFSFSHFFVIEKDPAVLLVFQMGDVVSAEDGAALVGDERG